MTYSSGINNSVHNSGACYSWLIDGESDLPYDAIPVPRNSGNPKARFISKDQLAIHYSSAGLDVVDFYSMTSAKFNFLYRIKLPQFSSYSITSDNLIIGIDSSKMRCYDMQGKLVAAYGLTTSPLNEVIFTPFSKYTFASNLLGLDTPKLDVLNMINVSNNHIALMSRYNGKIYIVDMTDVSNPKNVTSFTATKAKDTTYKFTDMTHLLALQPNDYFLFTDNMVYAVNPNRYLGNVSEYSPDIINKLDFGTKTKLFGNRYLFIDDSFHERSIRIQKVPCIEERIRKDVIAELRGSQIITDVLLDTVADYLDNDVYSNDRFFKARKLPEINEQKYAEDKLILKKSP